MNDCAPELISLAESRGFERLGRVVSALDERLSIPNVAYPDLAAAPASDLPSLRTAAADGVAEPVVPPVR